MLLLHGCFKGFSNKFLSVLQFIKCINCHFNIADSPMSNIRNVTNKVGGRFEFCILEFQPNTKPTFLKMHATEILFVVRIPNIFYKIALCNIDRGRSLCIFYQLYGTTQLLPEACRLYDALQFEFCLSKLSYLHHG